MPLQNLSLSNLYRATAGTQRLGAVSSSLNAANGMAGTAISMSSFSMNSVTTTLPFTYIVENTSENVTFAFTGGGLAFNNRIKGVAANYTVTIDDNTYFTVGGTGVTTTLSAKNLANTPAYSGSNLTNLTAYYEDGYNYGATGNYGFANRATKTVYSVDSYNSINSDVLCVATDTDILLADGTSVKASDLFIGDTIKTFVPTDMPNWLPENDEGEWYWWYQEQLSGSITTAPISNIYFSFIDEYVSINYDDIKVTKAHPFFAWDNITNTYQFTRAEDLVEGDKLIKYNATTGQIEETLIEKIEYVNKTLEIATITVDEAHTYLSNGYVSHNKGSATAPIPWQSLVCYLDANFASSYSTQGQTVWNDLSGNVTGFNMIGGNIPGVTAPTFQSATSPKYLTFATGKFGVKNPGVGSGTNLSNFNVSSGVGMTIIAFVKDTAGTILDNSSNFNWSVISNYASTTGAYAAASGPQTSWSGWQMHAVTMGNGTTSFYRNSGTAYASAAASYTGGISVSSYNLKLMTDNTGALGSFLYYNRILSSTEINNVYNNLRAKYGL